MGQFHWDNCKVRFVQETARSYAEKAMKEGHDARDLLKAYDEALHYCHGLTTDQMLNRDRNRYEFATPALTVWLAREHLKKDPRPIEDRWKQVVSRLKAEHLQDVEEDVRVRAEIAAKAPAIEAWFAKLAA